MIENLSTATPVEIDTALYDLYIQEQEARAKAEQCAEFVARHVARVNGQTGYRAQATNAEVTQWLYDAQETTLHGNDRTAFAQWARYENFMAQVDEISLETALYNDEFRSRGGWTRAFLVNNSNGHVHSSMSCSTCFPTTSYHWITEMSDHDEAEIVEKAGKRACTVCYPSAPVEVLTRPTQFFTPDEQAKAKAREEREVVKAAKAAAQIVIENWQDGSFFRTKVFKTERALTNALASALGDLCWYGEGHPTATEWLWNVEQGRKALPSWDYDKALATARKKVAKEGGFGYPKY